MSLFRKELCTIIADEETNFKAQRFADEHCVKDSIIDIKSISGTIAISFYTKERWDYISKELNKLFNCQSCGNYLVYVTEK